MGFSSYLPGLGCPELESLGRTSIDDVVTTCTMATYIEKSDKTRFHSDSCRPIFNMNHHSRIGYLQRFYPEAASTPNGQPSVIQIEETMKFTGIIS
jgi:hypothetical protein